MLLITLLSSSALAHAAALAYPADPPPPPSSTPTSTPSSISSSPSSSPSSKPSSSSSSKSTPTPNPQKLTHPTPYTPYDTNTSPLDPLCTNPDSNTTTTASPLCHTPICALSPLSTPRHAPTHTHCALALAGIVRIPDAVNGEDAFARLDYLSWDTGNGNGNGANRTCTPQLEAYGADARSRVPWWRFSACGAGVDVEGGAERVYVRGVRGGRVGGGVTGDVRVVVEEARVRNCCLNFERAVDVPGWPFCGIKTLEDIRESIKDRDVKS
ncbi:hypothetical protein EJ05DRAFT_535710 [Pseudovirgaria hyperparasitica]|uniref:Uncharacterized protein n=1 Tax=Pseudovirgaria hyperparasitica TaxID=470096 RepID=A0A6A6WD94_9PEZI|nr:uncharacterized protein EJ05DRAFT_535710 [Pseudovirgaria hyperparasitica]KAF2760802.1 hypothetical protein EJ05DRAFT_535710 [Pseudovirgaria hyperparasitica]